MSAGVRRRVAARSARRRIATARGRFRSAAPPPRLRCRARRIALSHSTSHRDSRTRNRVDVVNQPTVRCKSTSGLRTNRPCPARSTATTPSPTVCAIVRPSAARSISSAAIRKAALRLVDVRRSVHLSARRTASPYRRRDGGSVTSSLPRAAMSSWRRRPARNRGFPGPRDGSPSAAHRVDHSRHVVLTGCSAMVCPASRCPKAVKMSVIRISRDALSPARWCTVIAR